MTEEQLLKKKAAADAKNAFIQPKEVGFGHDLYNAHGPIIGSGKDTGKGNSNFTGLGVHPATRHDDVYGKDVNGIGFDLFGESFGDGVIEEEDFDGDHVKTWRERLLNGLESDDPQGLGEPGDLFTEFSPYRISRQQKTSSETGLLEWDGEGWVDTVEDHYAWWEHQYDGSWWMPSGYDLTDEYEQEMTALYSNDPWDELYRKFEAEWDSRPERNGIKFIRTNRWEVSERLKEQGFVNNPLYTRDGTQPRMVPKGALVTMGGVKRCNPHKGKCECHIPALKEVRKRMKNWTVTKMRNGKKLYQPKPGKTMEDLYTTNMVKHDGTLYTGPTTFLAILTNADRRNSCRAQTKWGKKITKIEKPVFVQRKQVVSWGAALKKLKSKTTTTTTTEQPEPEQQVPKQQPRKSFVW
jgi:hypothetical protein